LSLALVLVTVDSAVGPTGDAVESFTHGRSSSTHVEPVVSRPVLRRVQSTNSRPSHQRYWMAVPSKSIRCLISSSV